jgi:uncharacterized membrane protein
VVVANALIRVSESFAKQDAVIKNVVAILSLGLGVVVVIVVVVVVVAVSRRVAAVVSREVSARVKVVEDGAHLTVVVPRLA